MASVMPALQQAWIDDARAAGKSTGFPFTSVTLAQFVIESGWGEDIPPGSNNPFGIKAVDKLPSTMWDTHERVNGVLIPCKKEFAVFPTLQYAFEFHDDMFMTGPSYHDARQAMDNVFHFVDVMGPVYATGAGYSTLLRQIITGHDLTQYDFGPSQMET